MRCRIYTGPCIVAQIAAKLRDQHINVFLEGVAHVYIEGNYSPETLLAVLGTGFTRRDIETLP